MKLGGSLVAVAKALDVSRTMLYDIKNQKVPVSSKMWRKLEAAELAWSVRSDTAPPSAIEAKIKAAEMSVSETRELLTEFKGMARLDVQLDFFTRQVEWLEASLEFNKGQLQKLRTQAREKDRAPSSAEATIESILTDRDAEKNTKVAAKKRSA